MRVTVAKLSAAEAETRLDALTELLVDAVEGGASVGFLRPLGNDEARKFWRGAIAAVGAGTRVLLLARDETGPVGAVQLGLAGFPNQRHRADVMKLLVHRRARRLGAGRRLMESLEDEARVAGRGLITLDTVSGGAGDLLYRALGYKLAGVIPRYALSSDGRLEDTSIMYKEL